MTTHKHTITADAADLDTAPCTTCGELLDLTDPDGAEIGIAEDAPGREIERVKPGELAELLNAAAMPFIDWASALLRNTDFGSEGDADPSFGIIAAILSAGSSEEAMKVADMTPSEELCPKTPGAHSPLLRITGATPLKSTYDEGPPCFCVVHATIVATGEDITTSIGARAVQAVILKHIHAGWMPFEGVLVRRLKPTRAGFYPMNLEAGG